MLFFSSFRSVVECHHHAHSPRVVGGTRSYSRTCDRSCNNRLLCFVLCLPRSLALCCRLASPRTPAPPSSACNGRVCTMDRFCRINSYTCVPSGRVGSGRVGSGRVGSARTKLAWAGARAEGLSDTREAKQATEQSASTRLLPMRVYGSGSRIYLFGELVGCLWCLPTWGLC